MLSLFFHIFWQYLYFIPRFELWFSWLCNFRVIVLFFPQHFDNVIPKVSQPQFLLKKKVHWQSKLLIFILLSSVFFPLYRFFFNHLVHFKHINTVILSFFFISFFLICLTPVIPCIYIFPFVSLLFTFLLVLSMRTSLRVGFL